MSILPGCLPWTTSWVLAPIALPGLTWAVFALPLSLWSYLCTPGGLAHAVAHCGLLGCPLQAVMFGLYPPSRCWQSFFHRSLPTMEWRYGHPARVASDHEISPCCAISLQELVIGTASLDCTFLKSLWLINMEGRTDYDPKRVSGLPSENHHITLPLSFSSLKMFLEMLCLPWAPLCCGSMDSTAALDANYDNNTHWPIDIYGDPTDWLLLCKHHCILACSSLAVVFRRWFFFTCMGFLHNVQAGGTVNFAVDVVVSYLYSLRKWKCNCRSNREAARVFYYHGKLRLNQGPHVLVIQRTWPNWPYLHLRTCQRPCPLANLLVMSCQWYTFLMIPSIQTALHPTTLKTMSTISTCRHSTLPQ